MAYRTEGVGRESKGLFRAYDLFALGGCGSILEASSGTSCRILLVATLLSLHRVELVRTLLLHWVLFRRYSSVFIDVFEIRLQEC